MPCKGEVFRPSKGGRLLERGRTFMIFETSLRERLIVWLCVNLRGGWQMATRIMPALGLNSVQPLAGMKVGSESCIKAQA